MDRCSKTKNGLKIVYFLVIIFHVFMLYREIIAVSQIHTKHTNTLFGQNVELLHVKLVVHIVTTVRYI